MLRRGETTSAKKVIGLARRRRLLSRSRLLSGVPKRVRAILRRAATPRHEPGEEAVVEIDGLRIDPARRSVELDGRAVQLTYVEFELLRTLAGRPGRVFSRQALLEAIRGGSEYREPRTIDVHVRHLREKLERDPRVPRFVLTVRGVGYRFGGETRVQRGRRAACARAVRRSRGTSRSST
jgi:DNA-binding response OmpR family regulator